MFSKDSPLLVSKYDADKALKYYNEHPNELPSGKYSIGSFRNGSLYAKDMDYLEILNNLKHFPSDARILR